MNRVLRLGAGVDGEAYYVKRNNVRMVVKIGMNVEAEYETHRKIYNKLRRECKKYIVKPMTSDVGLVRFLKSYGLMKSSKVSMYAMEYVHGMSLREYLRMADEKQRGYIIKETKMAFECLWEKGYIHGDAHLGNILVVEGPSGPSVKLIDFGFTTKVETPKNMLKTKAQMLKWFKKEWEKVLKRRNIPKGNPNLVFIEPSAIPFFYEPNKKLIASRK